MTQRESRGRRRPAPAGPCIGAPPELAAWRFEAGGEAFALLEWPGPRLGIPSRTPPLSPAEEAVALLAARGRSNPDIARLRGSSPRTVANQLAQAFAKLGVGSRAELCAALATRKDDPP